jgi:hypothetical protein
MDSRSEPMNYNNTVGGYGIAGPVVGAPAYWAGKPTQQMHSICQHCGQMTPPFPNPPDPSQKLVADICRRMKIKEHELYPFAHLHAYEVGENSVAIFVVTKSGQSTLLEDDSGMFPCDKLITQLRLLAG